MMRRGFVLDALKARRMTQVFSDLPKIQSMNNSVSAASFISSHVMS